jgi:hypothetical protein
MYVNDMKARPWSEFEVKAEAYLRLRQAGFNVRGEWTWRDKFVSYFGRGCPRGRVRFDLVILDEHDNIVLILEVKRQRRNKGSRPLPQGPHYSKLAGAPCIYIHGMREAEDVLNTVAFALEPNPRSRMRKSTRRLVRETNRIPR